MRADTLSRMSDDSECEASLDVLASCNCFYTTESRWVSRSCWVQTRNKNSSVLSIGRFSVVARRKEELWLMCLCDHMLSVCQGVWLTLSNLSASVICTSSGIPTFHLALPYLGAHSVWQVLFWGHQDELDAAPQGACGDFVGETHRY